jgi:hypothetical protein
VVAVFLYYVCTGLGISVGYHRLHTHWSYKVPIWLEYFFAVCGALTLEGGPIYWVATHRIHHQKSGQPGDPHSPGEGAWWAHVGWILFGETARHPFYIALNAEEIREIPQSVGSGRRLRLLTLYHYHVEPRRSGTWVTGIETACLDCSKRRALAYGALHLSSPMMRPKTTA